MKNNETIINNWGILSLFTSYLKRNRAIIISMFLLPLIFILAVALNNKNIINQSNNNIGITIMLLWLVQASSFSIQTFLSILLDFKQSIIYRRIGLTRIKKLNFLIMASLFNLILMMISITFIFIVVLILLAAFKLNNVINSIFQWHFILILLFNLACLVLLSGVALLMSVFIKTRTGQTISSLIVNFLIIIPLFILIYLLNAIMPTHINIGEIIGIFFGAFLSIILISCLLYYLSWKFFKWYE